MFEFFILWVGVPLLGIGTGWLLVNELIVSVMKGKWIFAVLTATAVAANSFVLYALAPQFYNVAVAWILELVCATAVCLRYWHLYRTETNFHYLLSDLAK